jgi:hypothetical protein
MKIKLLICITGLIFFSNSLSASDTDSTKMRISLGATGGISQINSLSGDIYGGLIIPINTNKLETNFGYLFFKNNTDYSGVKDLQFRSHGLFMEGNYYFTKGFYGGARFAINFNWVDKESQEKFEIYPDTDSPTFFSGIAGYGHLGYHLSIGEKFGIKLQGQIGLHNYKIAEGWLLIDNSSSDVRNAQFGIERHAELLYNLSIGLTFKL